MDSIRIQLHKRKYKKPVLFTVKQDKPKTHSKYGVVRFITKLIQRTERVSPSQSVSQTKLPIHAEHVVRFIQIFTHVNKIDTIFVNKGDRTP